ncbi:MAG: hypothetical protein P8J68_10605 [Arenicellaceae bacterium]|jgi:hypothetical protein|nr:hypothetical protein [Arenicellaceae bacterium]
MRDGRPAAEWTTSVLEDGKIIKFEAGFSGSINLIDYGEEYDEI